MSRRRELELRKLSAELSAECSHIGRTVGELQMAHQQATTSEAIERLRVYATAALLETFFTGFEKCCKRIAACFEGLGQGNYWYRELLESMALDIPNVRPPVIRLETLKALTPYLSFRHRFRNLYLFDLEMDRLDELQRALDATWALAQADLGNFADYLKASADELSGS